jgi:hypothetical protein
MTCPISDIAAGLSRAGLTEIFGEHFRPEVAGRHRTAAADRLKRGLRLYYHCEGTFGHVQGTRGIVAFLGHPAVSPFDGEDTQWPP